MERHAADTARNPGTYQPEAVADTSWWANTPSPWPLGWHPLEEQVSHRLPESPVGLRTHRATHLLWGAFLVFSPFPTPPGS